MTSQPALGCIHKLTLDASTGRDNGPEFSKSPFGSQIEFLPRSLTRLRKCYACLSTQPCIHAVEQEPKSVKNKAMMLMIFSMESLLKIPRLLFYVAILLIFSHSTYGFVSTKMYRVRKCNHVVAKASQSSHVTSKINPLFHKCNTFYGATSLNINDSQGFTISITSKPHVC